VDLASLGRRVSLSDGLPARLAVARDLWPRQTLRLAHGDPGPLPAAVCWPESEEEVAAVLAWASGEGVPVVPWGAGSGVCGAAAGRADAVTMDLKRLRRIGAVRDARVRVEAGVLGQHLEDALALEGWATRHSPSSIWCSTVGGWAASRSAGQFSSRYGTFPDMVEAMRVVTPKGVVSTGAWSEGGEDLHPWFLGSEGSLGVITELSVRVVPIPEARWLRGYRFATTEGALEAMRSLMQAELHPAVLRLYDPVDTRLAGKGTATRDAGHGAWLRALTDRVERTPALRRHALSLPLALPRLVNGIVRSMASGCVLIAGWEGPADVNRVLAEAGHELLLGAGGADLGPDPGVHWYEHRHEVSYKLAPVFSHGGFADTMEVAAPWSRLADLYAGVREALARHAVVMAHFSHAYQEGCSIYFTFAGRGEEAVYDAAWADALAAAAAAGGTVAHHHGVGQLKMAAAGKELAALRPLYLALKRRLDPAGILNPGRLFPEVDTPEPPAPALGVDAVSRLATLDAHAPAEVRDRELAAAGWVLRHPTPGPLAASTVVVEPWDTAVVGVSARIEGRRLNLPPVPRSAAGPDLRRALPQGALETLTVPVLPAAEAGVKVTRLAPGVRPARVLADGWELRGPAASALAEVCRAG